MSENKEYPKDTMILFRSTTRSKNSKGGDRLTLYLNQDQVESLIAELKKTVNNVKGAKLDLHTSKKTTKDTGRAFDSTIAFVKSVQEMSAGAATNTRFVKKGYDEDKVAKVSREIA